MKLVIFGAIAFVVGIGAGTGVGVMRAPAPKAVAADSTAAADSAHTASAHADSATRAPAASAPSETTHAETLSPAVTAAAIPPAASAANPAKTNATATDAPGIPTLTTAAQRRTQVYRQVAQILVNMKPTDAAGIMSRLTDDQLEGVFRALRVRQAATLMAQLPPDRAAMLSKRLFTPSEEAK